jgi:hypothetical protein
MDLLENLTNCSIPRNWTPVHGIKRATREIVEQETRHWPPEIVAGIVGPRLKTLGKVIVEMLEGRDKRDWYEVLLDLRADLRSAITWQRTNGRLKPTAADSEVAQIASMLSPLLYNSIHAEALRLTLEPGGA